VADCGERALIARIRQRLTTPQWVVVGPGDDAAAIEPVRGALEVITTDAQVEGVHFDRRFVPPDAIGHRALAVNLSDLAAMGARPRAALLSMALPPSLELDAFDRIVDGFLALAARHSVALIGGNITHTSGPMVLDVTALGSAHRRKMLTRNGAIVGDEVYVTGTLGDAATGLLRLEEDHSANEHAGRYLRPDPRVRAGLLLGKNGAATSCMDLSDGLADGVRQIAEASSVGMTLDGQFYFRLGPRTREWLSRKGRDPIEVALRGGDDFELVFTARPKQAGRLRAVRRHLGDLPITRIGSSPEARRLIVKDDQANASFRKGTNTSGKFTFPFEVINLIMWATISQSMRRKLVVLVIAVVGFLFMYEAEMFDSRSAFWQSLAQSGPPRPGSQMPFAATAYCKGSTTASGVVARTGVAAADPTLPSRW
jgi:thiamine-monophosphate kinase